MVADVSGAAISPVAPPRADAQPWPSRGAAYYGLFIIILATALNFLDAQIFSMMAQHIKADFHLTDEQLGFLLGPANIIFYVLVGIPLARLVDMYPRKYVLAAGILTWRLVQRFDRVVDRPRREGNQPGASVGLPHKCPVVRATDLEDGLRPSAPIQKR